LHRTQSYNELSARYTPIPDLNYVPTKERLLANAKSGNKQAGTIKGAEELCDESASDYLEELNQIYGILEASYQTALKRGVPKEIARIILPVGRFSRMRASANLRNWLQFLTLRQDSGAQWEIRQYANVVADMLTEKFPRTMELYKNGSS
jgi:thymidylate synthase (FAD)